MKCKKCGTEFEGNFCLKCGEKATTTCKKCGVEYIGDFCTNCGTKTVKQGKLLGFRTNKIWKKVLSIIFMVMIGFYILGSFNSIDSGNDAVNSVQGLLFMIAPYIFLSNFKLRNVLPLFNKHKKGLSFLGMVCVYFAIAILCTIINPATHCEHKWVEIEKVAATCTEDGHIKSHCDLCDSDNTEYIDKGHVFEIIDENEEKIVKKCSVCNEEKIEKKESKKDTESKPSDDKKDENKPSSDDKQTSSNEDKHKHKYSEATCEQAQTCSCGDVKGQPLGHTTDCGICVRCKKEFRKPSPITIINWTYNIDSAGGVEWNMNIKNNTDKQIKYVTLEWNCYNAVGDLIYDEIGWKSSYRLRFTGPLNAHSTSTRFCNATKFYNYTLKSYKLTEAIVEYMDGTTEKVTAYHDNVIK
jgi:hypothetical protein